MYNNASLELYSTSQKQSDVFYRLPSARYMIMEWKRRELVIVSFAALTLLAFAGILLELFLVKTIKGKLGNKFHKA